ncbi:hypothetical protein [Alteromonas oceanisediminis]|uniref:hypothetical protein n=1 Tax=Alteromonas oceanisediminis TaxID=2836180 RepID=UPI001BDB44D0|nr:hypothetical protein [Alteromonas oceanisediminis]MBT0586176.1 hypothetical protein [Alteromonas oceanisediminis]
MKDNNTISGIQTLKQSQVDAVSGGGWGGIIGGWGFGLGMQALGHAANNGGFALMERHNMALATNRL